MRRLSERNQVVWVNWHASRRPGIGRSDLCNIALRLWQIRRGAHRVGESISVLTPFQLPLPGSTLARGINRHMVRAAIRKVLAGLPERPVQIWSFAPDMADMVGDFEEELVVYYCVDAFGEFPGYDRDLIEQRERQLMSRSDVVITTSPPLFEGKRQMHSNVHLVQHGVDHGHLARAVSRELPVPPELAGLRKPIYGFVGIVGEWVDLDLVAGLARRHPEASVVMIGPEMCPRGACAGIGNIHWLGARDHQRLPEYLQCFDVGLIPFRQVPLTYNANPIKLYEYLAAGVPAVSSTMPAVRAMERSVWLADDADTLARACREAAACGSSSEREHRSKLMLEHAWTARIRQLGEIVDSTLHPSGGAVASDPRRKLVESVAG